MPIQTEILDTSYDGPTLYELILVDVLYITMKDISTKKRIRDNLSSLATRALFSSTNELSNAELLRILHTKSANSTVGTDTREARNLRSFGSERGLQFWMIRSYCLSLLTSRSVAKSEVARSWTYAVIHEAARQVVSNHRLKDQKFQEGVVRISPARANEMLNACFELVPRLLENDYNIATLEATKGQPYTEERRYLHFSSTLVLEAMDHPVNPVLAWHRLIHNTYPTLENYVF